MCWKCELEIDLIENIRVLRKSIGARGRRQRRDAMLETSLVIRTTGQSQGLNRIRGCIMFVFFFSLLRR